MAEILYHAVTTDWRKEDKYRFLEKTDHIGGVEWVELTPDKKGNWLTNDTDGEFEGFLPIGSKDAKSGASVPTVFRTYSLGVSTNRDAVVYDFDAQRLAKRVEQFAEDYNAELHRWQKKGKPADVDNFVNYDKIKWSRDLKLKLEREAEITFDPGFIREAVYRPFTKLKLYTKNPVVDREGTLEFFPTANCSETNRVIYASNHCQIPFTVFGGNLIFDAGVAGRAGQCFPRVTYSEDGKDRRDNITPKALTLFQIFYADDEITREDIFHYVYALLHHPAYRTRYAENLKRELPRIPFLGVAADVSPRQSSPGKRTKKLAPTNVGGYGTFFPLSAVASMQGDAKPVHDPQASASLFHALADAGRKLADLHVNYESAKEYPLKRVENPAVPLDWRVEAMKLSKDRSTILYNEFLRLQGIPPGVFDYRLGNRSALEWVIDQYRVTRDDHGEIASDPNRLDDEQYIVRLIGQVITVSLETLKIVSALPEVPFDDADAKSSSVAPQ